MQGSLSTHSISPREPYKGIFFQPVYSPPVRDRSTAWGWNVSKDHGPNVVITPDHEFVDDAGSNYPKTSYRD